MKRNIQTVLAAVAIAVVGYLGWRLVSPPAVEPVQTNEVVRVGYREHDLYAPLFVGLEQKIFARHGLDVQATKFESSNQMTDALIAGNIDAVLGGLNVPLLLTIEDKQPRTLSAFSLVNETATVPLTYLLVKKDSPIGSVADLRGKKIGAFQGSTAKYIYQKTVTPFFKPDEAELVQMNPELELAALESGQVDAVIVLEPLATIGVQKSNARILVSGLFENFIEKNFPNAASVMTVAFKQNHSEIAKKLVSATNEVIDFISTNPTETKKAITKFVPIEGEIIEHIHFPRFIKLSEVDRGAVQQAADVLLADKQIKTKVNIGNLFAP